MKIKFTKLIILALVLLVLLPSCENNKEITTETQQPTITSATVKPETTETTSQQNTTQSKSTQQTTVFQTSDTQQTTTTSTAVQTGTEKTTPKQTLVTQVSDTVKISTTTQLSENEDDNSREMPEVVFVLAHYNWHSDNGYGYYINNKGEVKSFDFTKVAPDEFYYIGDLEVYNMIEGISADTDFDPISKEKLTELYEKLLKVDDDSELKFFYQGGEHLDVSGDYLLCGTRFDSNKELEIIQLGEYGDLNCLSNDSYANELFEELKMLIPDPRTYLN